MPYIALPTADAPTATKRYTNYRTPLIIGLSLLLIVSYLFTSTPATNHLMSSSHLSSSPPGWHSRAVQHPGRDTFEPSRNTLAFGVLLNSRVEPEGFTVAFFKPDVAVDAMGHILRVGAEDWNAIDSLVNTAVGDHGVPDAGGFRNQWRIKQARTGYPIDWLRVPVPGSSKLKDLSVYGFDGTTTELASPVHGITQFPSVLVKLFTLVKEGREGFVRGEEDSAVVDKVKAILQEE